MIQRFVSAAAMVAAIAMANGAFAHVTLETKDATVGGSYKAVLKVPHGCAGSPTVKIRVQIPEGVIGVRPMPKAGWQIEIVKGKYERSYTYFGHPVSEGAKEVSWSGGNLSDEHYDEFVLQAYLTDSLPAGSMLYFPVVQECVEGVDRWIEIPAAGKTADDYESPAPGLKLLPKP